MQTIDYKYINFLKCNLVNNLRRMLTIQNFKLFIINMIFTNKT